MGAFIHSFGTTLPSFGLKGFVVMSSPANACSSIEPPPLIYKNNSENVGGTKWFVLIRRFDCSFVDKVSIIFKNELLPEIKIFYT